MIKRFLKKLMGEPKNGKIVETINPILYTIIFLISIFSIYLGYMIQDKSKFFSASLMMFGIIFAWQLGWSMKISRFEKSEKKKISEDPTLQMLNGDYDGDLLDLQKISKMSHDELLEESKKLIDVEPGRYDDYFIPINSKKQHSDFQVGNYYVHKHTFLYIKILYDVSHIFDDTKYIAKDINNNCILIKDQVPDDFIQLAESEFYHAKYCTKK